jgi:hypothetical protein
MSRKPLNSERQGASWATYCHANFDSASGALGRGAPLYSGRIRGVRGKVPEQQRGRRWNSRTFLVNHATSWLSGAQSSFYHPVASVGCAVEYDMPAAFRATLATEVLFPRSSCLVGTRGLKCCLSQSGDSFVLCRCASRICDLRALVAATH